MKKYNKNFKGGGSFSTLCAGTPPHGRSKNPKWFRTVAQINCVQDPSIRVDVIWLGHTLV